MCWQLALSSSACLTSLPPQGKIPIFLGSRHNVSYSSAVTTCWFWHAFYVFKAPPLPEFSNSLVLQVLLAECGNARPGCAGGVQLGESSRARHSLSGLDLVRASHLFRLPMLQLRAGLTG